MKIKGVTENQASQLQSSLGKLAMDKAPASAAQARQAAHPISGRRIPAPAAESFLVVGADADMRLNIQFTPGMLFEPSAIKPTIS